MCVCPSHICFEFQTNSSSIWLTVWVSKQTCWRFIFDMPVFDGGPRCYVDLCFGYPSKHAIFVKRKASHISIWHPPREGLGVTSGRKKFHWHSNPKQKAILQHSSFWKGNLELNITKACFKLTFSLGRHVISKVEDLVLKNQFIFNFRLGSPKNVSPSF